MKCTPYSANCSYNFLHMTQKISTGSRNCSHICRFCTFANIRWYYQQLLKVATWWNIIVLLTSGHWNTTNSTLVEKLAILEWYRKFWNKSTISSCDGCGKGSKLSCQFRKQYFQSGVSYWYPVALYFCDDCGKGFQALSYQFKKHHFYLDVSYWYPVPKSSVVKSAESL